MIDLGLSKPLSSLVSSKFTAAEKSGSLIFSATEVAIIKTWRGLPLQSRYCPALAKKPTANDTDTKEKKKPKPNPFDDPPQDLLVTSLPTSAPTHNIVLNKYPIIPHHFILATIPWKSQTALLEPSDLAVAYSLIQSWPSPSGSLFAFFNSGPHSGASQPHRHIQFLPVEDMTTSESSSDNWRPALSLLAETCADKPDYAVQACNTFPFAHFASHLPPDPTPQRLHDAYLSLYAAVVEAIPAPDPLGQMSVTEQAPDPPPMEIISYNLGMMEGVMAICPRRSEFGSLSDGQGEVGFNGTILAGTFMLKDEEVWNRVNERPERMEGVLEGIGYPFPRNEEENEDLNGIDERL